MCETVRFTLAFVRFVEGTHGPLKIDMGVYYHDIFDEERTDLEKKALDVITVCPNGEKVTLKRLKKALDTYAARVEADNKFNNGRTYFYEGMRISRYGMWEILWGS